METYERLYAAYLKFFDELENDNYEVEQDVIELEQEVKEALEYTSGKEYQKLSVHSIKINRMKKEFDFYDKEAELDIMFPDRHDEDFDEESMSYNSVFGED
jgi:hypothetical protein